MFVDAEDFYYIKEEINNQLIKTSSETQKPQGKGEKVDKQMVNRVVEAVLTGALDVGAAVGLATSSSSKDIFSLASMQVLTTTGKNVLKKLNVPKVVSYPVLIGTGVVCFFSGAPVISDLCFSIAAKNANKDMKDLIKGKPIILILKEGVKENIDRIKSCCKKAEDDDVEALTDGISKLGLEDKAEEVEGDSESDDIEWTPPPRSVQVAMIVTAGAIGAICYALLPLPNTGIELLNITSKMATVALRQLPLIPADGSAVVVGGIGAGIGYVLTGSAVSSSLPGIALSFPLDVGTDNVKMYIKGKWNDRALTPRVTCKSEEPSNAEGMQVENTGETKKKKKKKELPSSEIQTGILLADAAVAIGANFAQPQGGMLPHKATSLFTSLFDAIAIRGNSSGEELGTRFLGYGAAGLGSYIFDTLVPSSPVKMTKVVGSTVMKLVSTKEIKNLSSLDFVGGYEYLKEKMICIPSGQDQ